MVASIRKTRSAAASPSPPPSRAKAKAAAAAAAARQQHDDDGDEFEWEFFGPWGPALLVLALPCVVLGLVYACNADGCVSLLQLPPQLPGFPRGAPLYSHEAMLAAAGWFALVLLLHALLPGTYAQGVPLPSGRRLTYKLNAFRVFLVTYGTAALLSFGLGVLDLTWAADNFLPLATASIILSTALALVVYAASFRRGGHGAHGNGPLLARGGCSGVAPYDFWMGRELNPRLGWLDVKEFCELYPGMIGWALLNLAFAYAQRAREGRVGSAMLLVNAFELWYVADALASERAILTTMDITTDGFGFMLAFGDLSWVPFTFATQARYLYERGAAGATDLPPRALLLVLGVQLLGYCIFRGANGQKDQFRRDPSHPSVRHLESMPTARGTRLITSGWWGAARHVNYLGDWLMGLAWCLPCGLAGLKAGVPYFYCAYFAALLVHRERRDEAACRAKYGAEDWGRYCARVPWRIVPCVY